VAEGRTVIAGLTLAFIVVWVVVSGALVYMRRDVTPPRGVEPNVEGAAPLRSE